MAADLKFYTNDNMEMSSIDIGESRMNYGTVTSIKIKNEGKDKARDCMISATTLNTLDELKSLYPETQALEIYNQQLQAASWKTFSLSPDGAFTNVLDLGTIDAEKYLEGTNKIEESFSNKSTSVFQDSWSYCLEEWGNNSLKIYKNEAKSQTAQRKELDIGQKRDIDIRFKLKYDRDAEAYAKNSCLVIFPVRIDNTGKGYILSFQFRASDGKCYFGVYKNGKGMVSNLDRVYGTRIIDTNAYLTFDSDKFMGARIYNNDDDEICFEFTLNGEKQVLYKSSDRSVKGTMVKDDDKTFPNAGLAYFDVGMYYGDLGITLGSFSITTETDQAPVYIKSTIDSSAIDKAVYDSAISVSYVER